MSFLQPVVAGFYLVHVHKALNFQFLFLSFNMSNYLKFKGFHVCLQEGAEAA